MGDVKPALYVSEPSYIGPRNCLSMGADELGLASYS